MLLEITGAENIRSRLFLFSLPGLPTMFFNPAKIPGVVSVGKEGEFPSPLTPHTFDKVWAKFFIEGNAKRTDTRYVPFQGRSALSVIFWFSDGGYLIVQENEQTYLPFWIGCEHTLSMKKSMPFLRNFCCTKCGYTFSQDSS